MEENKECKHFIKSSGKCRIDLCFCSKKRKLCESRKLNMIYGICQQLLNDDYISSIAREMLDIIER